MNTNEELKPDQPGYKYAQLKKDPTKQDVIDYLKLKTRPEHDCEFLLTTDVCVHSCGCENITVSDSSLSVEYVPLKKYQVLQSENSEITLSLQVANQGLDILYGENEELKSENQKLREQLKEANDTIKELEKFDER